MHTLSVVLEKNPHPPGMRKSQLKAMALLRDGDIVTMSAFLRSVGLGPVENETKKLCCKPVSSTGSI